MKTSKSPLTSSCDLQQYSYGRYYLPFLEKLAFYTWPDLNAKLLRKFKHKFFNENENDFLNYVLGSFRVHIKLQDILLAFMG